MKASKATIAGRECWIVSIPKSLCGKRTRIKRTTEIQRLDGKDVDLERGEIFVRKMKTEGKGIQERYVIGTPNAVAWLKKLALPATGPVIEINDKNFRLNRDAVIVRANGEDPKEAMKPGAKAEGRKGKLIEWPYNVLRRSFASYHLAAFENPNLTAMLMGHTTADTTFAKYRAVRRKELGKRGSPSCRSHANSSAESAGPGDKNSSQSPVN